MGLSRCYFATELREDKNCRYASSVGRAVVFTCHKIGHEEGAACVIIHGYEFVVSFNMSAYTVPSVWLFPTTKRDFSNELVGCLSYRDYTVPVQELEKTALREVKQ